MPWLGHVLNMLGRHGSFVNEEVDDSESWARKRIRQEREKMVFAKRCGRGLKMWHRCTTESTDTPDCGHSRPSPRMNCSLVLGGVPNEQKESSTLTMSLTVFSPGDKVSCNVLSTEGWSHLEPAIRFWMFSVSKVGESCCTLTAWRARGTARNKPLRWTNGLSGEGRPSHEVLITASMSSRLNQGLALSQKKSLLIAAKRMCLEIICTMAPCCAASLLPSPSGSVLQRLASAAPAAASANGPRSSGFCTALALHSSSLDQRSSSSRSSSSNSNNAWMIFPCAPRNRDDSTTFLLSCKISWQHFRANSLGKGKDAFNATVRMVVSKPGRLFKYLRQQLRRSSIR